MNVIAERLTKLRTEKGATQEEVAEACGLPRVTLARYENGTRKPISKNLSRLAEYYGKTVDYLLGRDDFYQRPQEKAPILILDNNPVRGWPDDELDRQLREEWSSLPDEIKKSTIAYIKFQKYGTKE